MEVRKIKVKSRAEEIRTMGLPGAEYEQGLETVKRIAVRTRTGEVRTVEIPGEYVRNARTVRGVAAADILSGETVYGEVNGVEFRDENGGSIVADSILTSADGKTDAVENGHHVYVFRWENGKQVLIGKTAKKGMAIAISKDGSLLITFNMEDHTGWEIYRIGEDVTFLSKLPNAEASGHTGSGYFSPDGTVFLLSGFNYGGDDVLRIYSVNETGFSYERDFLPTEVRINRLAFSPDGGMLIGGGYGGGWAGKKLLISGTTITEGENLYVNGDTGESVCFSPDGALMLLGGSYGKVYVYSVEGTTLTRLPEKDIWVCEKASQREISDIVFSPDGKLLVLSGQFPGGVKIYSVEGSDFTLLGSTFGETQVRATGGISGEGTVVYSQKTDYPSERVKGFLVRGSELVPEGAAIFCPAVEGKIPAGGYLVGFAQGPMEQGKTGTARIIGEVSA